MSELTIKERVNKFFRRAILRTFPPCKEIVHIISASLDRPLTLREKFLMRMHLLACKPCVRYLDQSEFVASAVRIMDESEKIDLFSGSLSDSARSRIKAALRSAG
jgi:hypothetical protein